MLILHSMPAITGVTLSAGAWLVADGGAAMHDGRPTRRAALSWPVGTPSIGQYVAITLQLTAPVRLRGVAALGLSVPAGTRVEFLGPAGQGLGGNTVGDVTRTMPDGTTGLIAVADDTGIADASVTMRIYNDCNGLPWATAGMPVYIGEVFAGGGVEVELGSDWSVEHEDPSQATRTRGSQLNTVRWSPYRVLSGRLVATHAALVFYGADGSDWTSLRAALAGDSRCIVIPRWRRTGALDPDAMNATGMYGVGRVANIQHLGGDYYEAGVRFEEVPAQ